MVDLKKQLIKEYSRTCCPNRLFKTNRNAEVKTSENVVKTNMNKAYLGTYFKTVVELYEAWTVEVTLE